ncbi:hypothetical protein [Glycomyces salinus]|uniref:hypothetical protein n=1 Tax=Glycomyces salinus TaxID=980294 RepID=UPI0018EE266E|nr:hypothetical protein [Glycomyces salinus]
MARIDGTIAETKKLLAVGGIGLFAAMGLAACGGSEDGEDGGSDASTSASAVEEETAAEDAAVSYGDGTAPDAPLEPGASVEIADWSVSVGEVVLDATDQILDHDSFNEAPEAGRQYIMIELVTTYNGADASDPYLDLDWDLWDGTLVDHTEPIVLLPNDLMDVRDVAGGESASGNIFLEVPEGDYSTASVVIGEMLGDDEFYLALG